MSTLTAIKIPILTRDHLRDAARAAGMSQGALIEQMLRDREDAQFWDALAASGPLDDEETAILAEGEAAGAADLEAVDPNPYTEADYQAGRA
jgi:hypothetical protein